MKISTAKGEIQPCRPVPPVQAARREPELMFWKGAAGRSVLQLRVLKPR